MNKIISNTFKVIFFLVPFLSVIVLFYSPSYIKFGEIAYKILILMMFSRPLRDIAPKKLGWLDKVVRVRKELGIIVGVFAIAHSIGYFLDTGVSFDLIVNPDLWYLNSFLAWGFIGFFVTIPLLLTSNTFSVLKLGKYWKKLQFLAYIMFFATVGHVAFISEDYFLRSIILAGTYLFVLILASYLNKKRLSDTSSIKYVCVPCQWVYDEAIGDPDSGIAPGTRFEDIPDDWVCPVCGVDKSYFVRVGEEVEINYLEGRVKEKKYINEKKDVIELVLEIDELKESPKRGQFMTFNFKDINGEFARSYSISETNGNNIHFLIKLLDDGRASKILKEINVDELIKTTGPYGDFALSKNDNNKVFIATGTGLAPIYNMILGLDEEEKKTLFFGVSNLSDLFYLEKLSKIKNLKLHIFLSRENTLPESKANIKYYNSRICLDLLGQFNKETYFYICGNPNMIDALKNDLKNKGYQNIYIEKFG